MLRLPDDAVGALKTGDLIFASKQDEQTAAVGELQGPHWFTLGMVVRPSDFGISLGEQELLVYSPKDGELSGLTSRIEHLPEQMETVAVAKLDDNSTSRAVQVIVERIGFKAVRSDSLGDEFRTQLRYTVGDPSRTPEMGDLPALEHYSGPPLLIRTCRFDGNLRPCPIHG